MALARSIALWLFVYLAVSVLLASAVVATGHAPSYPVFEVFGAAPAAWRIAYCASGLLAALTAFLLHRKSKVASLSAPLFIALFYPSYNAVWGQVALGSWIAVIATGLALVASLGRRNEV